MEHQIVRVPCQRIGCNALFTEDDNPEGSCQYHDSICKNKGCGKTFTEMENHDTACSYHPGPPVFHDRMRGWQCCNIHVKEFDEFMDIAPCSRGWHNAGPA